MGIPVSQFAQRDQACWIDYYAYAAKVFGDGAIPWLNQTQFANLHGQIQALLKSGVISLHAEPVMEAILARNTSLVSQMASKSRIGYPLRSLLGDATFRSALTDLLQPLRSANDGVPLVLCLPSPGRWLELAYRAAHGQAPDEISAGEIEKAAVYMADFMGAMGDSQIDAVLLAADPQQMAAAQDELAGIGPVSNKARHYRWEIGYLHSNMSADVTIGDNLDFLVSPKVPAGQAGGVFLRYASDQEPQKPALGSNQFYYVEVDADADPENLLTWLGQ